jgi:hypothetical protein
MVSIIIGTSKMCCNIFETRFLKKCDFFWDAKQRFRFKNGCWKLRVRVHLLTSRI